MGLAAGADDKKYAELCVQCAAKATTLAEEWTATEVERALFAASYLPLDTAPASVKRAAEEETQTDDEGEAAAKKSKTAQ